MLTRRELLKLLSALGLATSFPISAWGKPGSQLMRKIPASGEMIPAMGLGTSRTFDVGPDEFEREPLLEVLDEFIKQGGSLIDSSPMYGHAETVIGDLASQLKVQKKLFYATKVWTSGRRAGIEQMEQSMQRMKTRVIDLMQVHNLVDTDTHMKTLTKWKEQGKIRYIGITHYLVEHFDELEATMKKYKLDFVQLPYSIVTREAEQRLLPLARDKGIAVLVNRPYEKAALFRKVKNQPLPAWAAEFDCHSWGQFFLKFILANQDITCVIPATSKTKHLVDNMGAGLGKLPNEEARKKMYKLVASL
ncbi:MAG: aldo/keto reductase [Gammaproteobacteria bacterium]|nr:aldo/keto reductase [Gammaproteobacteria bacterium]